MAYSEPGRRVTAWASARRWILDSRLGSCWRCMTFTACMAVISTAALFLTMRWQDLEGVESRLLAGVAVGIAFIATCAFALLGLTHLVCLLLKRSIWRQDPHRGHGTGSAHDM